MDISFLKKAYRLTWKKIEKLKDWPLPQNSADVRQFLRFAGYYRRFSENFSKIAKPLYNIIGQAPRKRGRNPDNSTDPEFVWAEQQQQAFNTLKDRLTFPSVLGYARPVCPFVLYTDASGKGLGAVLSQKQDGVERVISYASHGLSKSGSQLSYP